MNVTSSAHKHSLSELVADLNAQNVKDNAEIRVKGGGKVLYEKTSAPGRFSKVSSRTKIQDNTRKLINESISREFQGGKEGGAHMAAAVRHNMRDILQGTGKVTKADLDSVADEAIRIQSARRNFTNSTSNLRSDPSYEAGRRNPADILPDIEGFNPDMTASEGIDLYNRIAARSRPPTDEAKKLMGALAAFVRNKENDSTDLSELRLASKVSDVANKHGATSMRTSPQGVHLRQIGDGADLTGRCSPLVALAALAESRGKDGGDTLMQRLNQENQEMHEKGVRHGTDYSSALQDLHGSTSEFRTPITDKDGEKVGCVSPKKALAHLANKFESGNGEPVMYGVEVSGGRHIVLMGATQHQGETSYMFYDPNMGLVRFPSKEGLEGFMSDYFGELGFDKHYQTGDGKSFVFGSIGEIDVQKLSQHKLVDGAKTPIGDLIVPK